MNKLSAGLKAQLDHALETTNGEMRIGVVVRPEDLQTAKDYLKYKKKAKAIQLYV
jgi:hypothetical protein